MVLLKLLLQFWTISVCPPPIANAGSPQSVDAGTTEVVLDGSGSFYSDNQASFSWKQIGGNPTEEIKYPGAQVATFDAPVFLNSSMEKRALLLPSN